MLCVVHMHPRNHMQMMIILSILVHLYRLHSKKWDERLGWGTPLPSDLQYRGGSKAVLKWAFNGASLDQGLLTDYFVLHQGRVQLLDSEYSPIPVQVYGEGYAHTGMQRCVLNYLSALRIC